MLGSRSILPIRLQALLPEQYWSSEISASPIPGNSSSTMAGPTTSAIDFGLRDGFVLRGLTAAAVGVALHHIVFRKGEWHLQAPAVFTLWLLSYPALFVVELGLGAQNAAASALNTITTLSCLMGAVFASMTVYRLFFHRLRSFPGPKMARVSKLWHSYQCLDGKNHHVLDKLNRQYGDFVRTGPSEITIFNPEALVRLDGPGNKTTKSIWYDFLMPDMGVTTIRDVGLHDKRRKIWTQAFSTKALNIYEYHMAEHAERLEGLIAASAKNGTPVAFSQMAYWFSFDVMGTFALSESFNMINDKQWHYAVSNLRRAMSILGPLSPVPWLAQIGFRYLKGYWVVKDWHSMTGWCSDRMQERIKLNSEGTNIASYLISDAVKNDSIESDHHLLAGEAIVAIVAGSDTVAPTMVCLFYELARNPNQAEKLLEELQAVDVNDRRALEKLPHLNALIDETMRLHPAVPTGGYRDSPPEGLTIGGRFIPGNTTIVAPRYTIFRSEKCYEEPNSFIPERWTSRPELIKDSRSFKPFGQGRYTCLGKSMALSELRVVTAMLVSKYKIGLPAGDAGEAVERDYRDQFTAAPGKLDLVFTARE